MTQGPEIIIFTKLNNASFHHLLFLDISLCPVFLPSFLGTLKFAFAVLITNPGSSRASWIAQHAMMWTYTEHFAGCIKVATGLWSCTHWHIELFTLQGRQLSNNIQFMQAHPRVLILHPSILCRPKEGRKYKETQIPETILSI